MLKILCTGDVHMGRTPSRLRSRDTTARAYTTTQTWRTIVDLAISERVEVVLISGDLIDHENRLYESRLPVEEGVRKLAAAGIPVVAVCGNHDADVLPAIADRITGLTLLGRDQTWETWAWPSQEAPALVVHGWSFRQMHVIDNPLSTYTLARHDHVPTIGLLHCDLDDVRSKYAPVQLGQFESLVNGPDCWIIGHIHVAANRARSPLGTPILYTGSPGAMDPGEEGDHGPWILEIAPDRTMKMTHVHISPVAYRTLRVIVDSCESEADAGEAIVAAIKTCADDLLTAKTSQYVRSIVCRVIVRGAVPLNWNLGSTLNNLQEQITEYQGIEIVIDRITDATTLQLHLDEIANNANPPGLLARQILMLRRDPDDPERVELVARARNRLKDSVHHRFQKLDPPSNDDLAEAPELEATLLLRELLGQHLEAMPV